MPRNLNQTKILEKEIRKLKTVLLTIIDYKIRRLKKIKLKFKKMSNKMK